MLAVFLAFSAGAVFGVIVMYGVFCWIFDRAGEKAVDEVRKSWDG